MSSNATVGGSRGLPALHLEPDRIVETIERLAPNLLSSTRQLAAPFFPDSFVEGVIFFKRLGVYYLIYSSCCCCCTAGAGAVVFRASSVAGPWVRQPSDVNCDAGAAICAGMPASHYPERPTGHLIIPAQGFNVARLSGVPLRSRPP